MKGEKARIEFLFHKPKRFDTKIRESLDFIPEKITIIPF